MVGPVPANKISRFGGQAPRRARNLVQSALVITLAGGHVQFRAAHAHFDAVIILAAVGILRLERDGVLIAGLLGDGSVEFFQPAILG